MLITGPTRCSHDDAHFDVSVRNFIEKSEIPLTLTLYGFDH